MKETLKKFQTCNFRRCLVPAVLLFAAACSKDPMTEIAPAGRSLRFDVSQDDGWHTPQSRATIEEAEPTAVQVIPLQDETSADALFLHVTVTDGIERPASSEEREAPKTRAACVDDMSEYGAFAVNGFTYKGAWDSSLTPDLMNRVEVVEQGNGIWAPASATYHWPGAGKKVRFFAYAPMGIPNVYDTKMISVGNFYDKDILFADSGEMDGDTEAPVPLTFKHIMSCVRFVAGDDMKAGKISSIQFRNVYSKHTFSFETGNWSILDSSDNTGESTFAAYSSNAGNEIEVDGTAGAELCQAFIAPQRFTENATIYVAFRDALTSTDRMLTASLAGVELPMGKTVTFRISTSSISVIPTFNVATTAVDFPYTGGSIRYSVRSYLSVSMPGSGFRNILQPWVAEFVEEDDNGDYRVIDCPDWVQNFTTSGDGSLTSISYRASVASQTGIPSSPHNDLLKATDPVAGIYDLSTDGGTTAMTTANCYIVNAPGTYSLPLVYGNAVRNGATNVSAYTSTAAGGNVLKTFINHLDREITGPYICDNAGCTPSEACLVWQDEPDLVTHIALSEDKRNLTFDVAATTIRQGNAVVAVKDANGDIMWSWHIWVTDYRRGDDIKRVTNNTNAVYEMMPVNIGWCDPTTTVYPARNVKVRFVQTQTGETVELTIAQTGHSENATSGNNPYFQWGRKDPMLPGLGGDTDKPYYSSDYTFERAVGANTFGTGIKTPHIYYYWSQSDPCPTQYVNTWNANYTNRTVNDDEVVKTIYDPSPAGYHLPASAAFTGITSDAQMATNGYGVKFNMPYSSASDFDPAAGVDFYCNRMPGDGQYDPTGGTIRYPTSGGRTRSAEGRVVSVGSSGFCWTAGSYFIDYGFCMHLQFPSQTYAHRLQPSLFALRSNAYSVRPVKETE